MANLTKLISDLISARRIPLATYRLQFSPDFGFQDAQRLVAYLNELGITDLYTSPLFKPRSGSEHGYDIVDYNQLNPALGTYDDFYALSDELRAHGIGLLLDIVPNHMGVSTENEWWMDVLKHGPSSIYTYYFDIDWRQANRALDDKVLIPVLDDHFGRVLESGQLEVVYWHGDFYLHYYDHRFPISPETYVGILMMTYEEMTRAGVDDWSTEEVLSVITALEHLPPYTTRDQAMLTLRRRESQVARRRSLRLFDGSEAFPQALERALERLNGIPGDPESFDQLDDLLSAQPYRLSYWRVAADEINYRRFFTINDMAAIRIELPDVFADVHRLTVELLADNHVTGLRIDHPDGLWNPSAYFKRLQVAYTSAKLQRMTGEVVDETTTARTLAAILEHTGDQPADWPLYVLVEKILSATEPLPVSWAVYGTTGYDFMTIVNNLFVDSRYAERFDSLYTSFTGQTTPFSTLTADMQKMMMSDALASELDSLSTDLAQAVERNRRFRGFTRNSLARALGEVIAALPIYRTYITGPDDVSERDRHYVNQAIRTAKARNPRLPESLFDFVRDVLLLANLDKFAEPQQNALRRFVMEFQQITGPVMAKSVEDTAFYIYNRLVSLNEVGGHPDHFGHSVANFHQHHQEQVFPFTMLASSTHDTKRSEDVRARINVLSELPDEWEHALNTWSQINAFAVVSLDDGTRAPSRNDEYALYQNLVGTFPADPAEREDMDTFRKRMIEYMRKAVNEAKIHSNWINPNEDYLEGIAAFIRRIMKHDEFRMAFEPFQQRVSFFGQINSLSQTLLKLTAPGVPDIYQGNELWDFSLVDPDNRRPVDFERRIALLAELKQRAADDPLLLSRDVLRHPDDGAVKLYLTYQALELRRARRALFLEGDYLPLEASGAKTRHVCAFLRRFGDDLVLVVVPRLVVGLTAGQAVLPIGASIWEDTCLTLPPDLEIAAFTNRLTGEDIQPSDQEPVLKLADLLATFPVGLFEVGGTTDG